MQDRNSYRNDGHFSKVWAAVVFFLVALVLIFYVVYIIGNLPPRNITNLSSVEIQEYQGEQLSSIGDFRENSIHDPQYIDKSRYTLVVTGLVDIPQNYTYDEVLSSFPLYRKVVTLHCVDGWDVTILWEGIKLADLLDAAGVEPGADTVIFRAEDGYSSSLPLQYVRDLDIILAYKMNNFTLPAERGFPFQLVAEEKWGYKWVKWVREIEVSSDVQYRGYWEQRGYSLNGSSSRSYFEWWPW
jgi:DMSO/TMAO reductase YedYZ molybdopterin-dependent catalytic subunit